MRHDLHSLLHQGDYTRYRKETAEWLANAYRKSVGDDEFSKMEEWMDPSFAEELENAEVSKAKAMARQGKRMAKAMLMKQFADLHMARTEQMRKAGVNTALGYNFYDLRGPTAFLFPVETPLRNSMPRTGKVNAGYGDAAHWMATRDLGSVYGGVSEGNRNAVSTPDQNDYLATYKGLGGERQVTFESEWAGEGFTGNLADEHIRGLYEVFLQEEGTIFHGNAGAAAGGFALGTPTTPTIARNTVSTGGFSGSTDVSVAVVALTALGYPKDTQYGYLAAPTVTSGLTPTFVRTNADGSQDTINGGISAISAMSAVVNCDATHQTATAYTTPPKGAFAYAWYVNTTDSSNPSLSNAKLYSITTVPRVTITAAAAGTQTGAASGLSTDHSWNTLDFNGLTTYAAATPGYWFDCTQDWNDGNRSNNSLTSGKDGTVAEIETALLYFYDNFRLSPSMIWGSSDAVKCLQSAVRWNGSNAGAMMLHFTKDEANNLVGGFVVSGYQNKYATNAPNGSDIIPIRIHPQCPKGTLYFDLSKAYSHARIPQVRSLFTRRAYYSIEWPVVSRNWTMGTYVDECLAHFLPWATGVITGVGDFVAP